MSSPVIGYIEALGMRVVGWAFSQNLAAPLTICCVLDETLWITTRANIPRPDVAAALGRTDACGFSLEIPPVMHDGREHRITLTVLEHPGFRFPCSHATVVLGAAPIDVRRCTPAELQAAFPAVRGFTARGHLPCAFLAFSHGRAVGYALCGVEHFGGRPCCRLLLDVQPAWRLRGVAGQLVLQVQRWAWQAGTGLMITLALPDGGVADFYERRGFLRLRKRSGAHGGEGTAGDVLHMVWWPGSVSA